MEFKKVKSSQIKEIGFDGVNQTIHVIFNHKNKLFLYHPFNRDLFNDFLNAESVGKHFHKHIKKSVVIPEDVQECEMCEDNFYVDLMHATGDAQWFCKTCYQAINN